MAEEMLYTAEEMLGRLAEVLSIKMDKDKNLIHFNEEDGAFEVLPKNFFDEGGGEIFGWKFGEPFALYKEVNDKVYIVVWTPIKSFMPQACEKIAKRYRGDEAEAIRQIGNETEDVLYEEYETLVDKKNFFESNQEECFKEAKKLLQRKMRKNLNNKIRMILDNLNDTSILDGIPDYFIITFEDSLASGNCIPGTEEFRDRYFPGQTETTAGELKKFADNRDVMRIFRYIIRESF